jgi:hypothetical protein
MKYFRGNAQYLFDMKGKETSVDERRRYHKRIRNYILELDFEINGP